MRYGAVFCARGGAVLAAMALVLALVPVHAQTTASILGTVSDETGAVVAGAQVRALNTLTNEARSTVTNELGYYSFPELPVGVYRVQAERQGFKTAVREGITLSLNRNARVDIQLSVGAAWPGLPAEPRAVRWGPAVPRQVAASSPVAFVNVNVVPMDAEGVLERHTVVVRDGRIAAVGPTESVEVPADAERIEAEGWYLMPGLADMHTHFGSDDADWRNDLFLFVANGVTTVREMWGSLRYLRWREAIAAGAALGPRLCLCGPGMDGAGGHFTSLTPPITTPEQARLAVAYYKGLGYDYIKVYSDLTLEVYAAIVEEARVQGIKVVGHIPSRVGLANVLAAGQYSIEHFIGFAELASSTGSLVSGILDESRLKELAGLIRDAGVWNTPTVVVGLVPLSQVPAMRARPEMRYVSPSLKRWFDNPVQTFPNRDLSLYEANLKAVLKVLAESGVKLLLGVDSGFRYVLPGFSIHDELRLQVEAGLTPYRVLRMGTANVAEFLDGQDYAGTVAVGKRADLLLLRENPLEDVRNVGQRVGVMVGGLWLSEEWLRERLEEIARSYGN